jgi:adenylylsulfate kinase-like enzyme
MTPEEQRTRDEALAFAKAHKWERCRVLTDQQIYRPEKNPVCVFMAGSPGAGKTESAKEIIAQLEKGRADGGKVLRIDPDDLRREFPGYVGSNSWLFQAATSIWVEKMLDMAFDHGQSFLLDGTLSNLDRARKNVKRSLRKKRSVLIMYVYQSPLLSWEFVQAREAAEGRRIPAKQFIDQYFAARDVVNALKDEFRADIKVDLLFKPSDATPKTVHQGIDRIDTQVPEQFTRAQLEAELGIAAP